MSKEAERPASPMRKARIRRGLTLLGLSELCKERGAPVSEAQLSRIERQTAVPRPELRAVLADELGLDAFEDLEKSA